MPMERYVNGLWFEGVVVPDKWVIRTWEANGVMERSAAPYVMWREIHDFGFKHDGWTPIRPVDPWVFKRPIVACPIQGRTGSRLRIPS